MLQVDHPLLGKEIVPGDLASPAIRAADDCARFNLRIDPSQGGAAGMVFGAGLPVRIGETTMVGERFALKLGPDEWLLMAPLSEAEAILEAFSRFQPAHSLVDVGHREVGIIVDGPAASLALRSAITFAVDDMPAGTGCRTIFDKAQIVLIREAEDRFRIEVWHSFAEHVWGILQSASREIALGI